MENYIFDSFQRAGLYDVMVSTAITEQQFKLFSMLKPKIYKDGNQWCVLLGDNLQDGVCGFGESPFKAITDFDKNFYSQISEGEK